MKKIISILLLFSLFSFLLCSCVSEGVYTVNSNISSKANQFQVLRRVTVYNARTDLKIFEIEGYCAITNNSSSELVITSLVGDGLYKKNYVYLNDYVLYVVEDISGTYTDPYHYEVNYYFAVPDINIYS